MPCRSSLTFVALSYSWPRPFPSIPTVRRSLTINPLQPPLGCSHRSLGFVAADAIARKHVQQDEIRNRRCRLLADRAETAGRQAALAGLAKNRRLRIGSPRRVLVVGVEAVGHKALRRLEPWIELGRLQHERHQ